MSLQSSLIFPVKKRSVKKKFSADNDPENCNPVFKIATVKRVLFENLTSPVSLKKSKFSDENCRLNTPQVTLGKQDISALQIAKQAFHTGLPTRLIGRSAELDELLGFFNDHISNRKAGSMYISGAPGTGKTSSLMHVMKKIDHKFSYAFVNCMSVNNSTTVFKTVASELGLSTKATNKNMKKSLETHIVTSKVMNVLILDEIDQLDSKGQEILYSIFEWPQLTNSTLILIGIANALDLTDRVLPRLHAFKYQPKLMHFQPYTKDEIASILEDRLSDVQRCETDVIKPIAIQLCARKIAACSGDIRKALDVCRRSIEVVENQAKRQLTLQPTSDDRCNPGSPKKRTLTSHKAVDLQDISQVLHDVYGSRLQTSSFSLSSGTVTLPLQQMVLLCTLILIKKHCKKQDLTLGKSYDIYKRVCKKRQIAEISECEFHSLCRLVELRGFIQLKPNKIARMTKVVLKIDEGEAVHVLQDKALLPAILSDHSCVL